MSCFVDELRISSRGPVRPPQGGSMKRAAAVVLFLAAATLTAAPCVSSENRLCLNGGRFAVDVVWKDFQANTGGGHAIPVTADTGYFWFFSSSNVELVVKVVDGRPLNGN